MPLSPGRQSLPEQVASRLHGLINDGAFRPGTQLPLQRDLAQRFGVSITVVRESLALLAASGLIWSRSGAGTFVTDEPAETLRYPMWVREPSSLDELTEAFEARDALEDVLLVLAAQRRDDGDIVRMRESLDDMTASMGDAEEYADADLALHLAIAVAARNRPLAGALAALRRAVREVMVLRAQQAICDGSLQGVVDLHHQLVGAIELADDRRASRVREEIRTRTRGLAVAHARFLEQ
jgi:GntR family transcriptional repressor for pyruvate dehydrogenase complex